MKAWLAAWLVCSTAPAAAAGPELAPDHSAYRVDTEVFGWSRDFAQVAAVGKEVRRSSRGRQDGQSFVLAFEVTSPVAVQNLHTGVVKHMENDDPLPIADVRGAENFLAYGYLSLWPVRPKRQRPAGWMKVTTHWESREVEPGLCQPAVGFVLELGGERRLQPHQLLADIKADCSLLKLTDSRVYWGRRDVAVAHARFDYSPNDNEVSFRYPVSALWRLAQPLRVLVRTPLDAKDPRVLAAKKLASTYGKVRVVTAADVKESSIVHPPLLQLMAARWARELDTQLLPGEPTRDADIVIQLAPLAAGSNP